MQFLILSLAALAAAGTIPASLKTRAPSDVCSALATPLCCQLDVLGLLNLSCDSPSDTTSVAAFEKSCADSGSAAKCCTLPLAGDGLLCADP